MVFTQVDSICPKKQTPKALCGLEIRLQTLKCIRPYSELPILHPKILLNVTLNTSLPKNAAGPKKARTPNIVPQNAKGPDLLYFNIDGATYYP